MAGVAGGAGEVILLCVTDYVTGALLINQFVCPSEKITQMRSSIHGISKSTLDNAILQRQTLSGWEGARSELWKYIDDNTILVGHALGHDLDGLRIIHPRIVDSGILSRNAVGIHRIQWGLQVLCSELLDIEIRQNKEGIHDCLEDVLATRELVLFCTRKFDVFQSWAKAKKSKEMQLEKEREIARQKRQEREELKKNVRDAYPDSDSGDEKYFHQSDITKGVRWPNPNTRYISWSD